MFKINSILTPLLICAAQVIPLAAALETQTNGNITTVNNQDDFITSLDRPLPTLPESKSEMIKMLNNLTVDMQNNSNMATAFNILLNSDKLTNLEKSAWLKTNFSKLPTPFLLLMALYEENLETAKNIYFLNSARMLIDADMCTDTSIGGGATLVKLRVFPALFNRFGLDSANPDLKKSEIVVGNIEKEFFKQGGFKKFDQEYFVPYTPPYWLAYHGMDALMNSMGIKPLNNSDKANESSLFKQESEYQQTKERVFKEIESYAQKRGNL